MSKKLTRWFNDHEFPDFYFRFPGLIRFQWLANRMLFHRSWLIRRVVGKHLENNQSGLSFLDVGCGTGDFMIPFARKYPAGKFVGLDKSPGNIRLLSGYCTKKHLSNVSLLSRDIKDLRSGSDYSVVLLASVLHIIHDRQGLLSLLHENMVTGGHLIIYVPVNFRRRLPGYKWVREKIFPAVDYYQGKDAEMNLTLEGISAELLSGGFEPMNHRFLYGPVGQVGYEISSMALLVIQKVPWYLSFLFALIYYPLLHPFVLVLFVLDYFGRNREGNGLLITAVKK